MDAWKHVFELAKQQLPSIKGSGKCCKKSEGGKKRVRKPKEVEFEGEGGPSGRTYTYISPFPKDNYHTSKDAHNGTIYMKYVADRLQKEHPELSNEMAMLMADDFRKELRYVASGRNKTAPKTDDEVKDILDSVFIRYGPKQVKEEKKEEKEKKESAEEKKKREQKEKDDEKKAIDDAQKFAEAEAAKRAADKAARKARKAAAAKLLADQAAEVDAAHKKQTQPKVEDLMKSAIPPQPGMSDIMAMMSKMVPKTEPPVDINHMGAEADSIIGKEQMASDAAKAGKKSIKTKIGIMKASKIDKVPKGKLKPVLVLKKSKSKDIPTVGTKIKKVKNVAQTVKALKKL